MKIILDEKCLNYKGTPNPDSTHEVYISKTLSKKLYSPMQIFYHGVYLIFLSDLLLPLY
jgi:hypothetical protein